MYSVPPSSSSSSSVASTELKLYQAFIFSVPIFFTFVILLLFYLFYLLRRRVDWSSLRMRTPLPNNNNNINDMSTAELGLNKQHREMLPIIIYKETFSITDTLCSVCLGEYQAEDKLQQIPACGHTFHMACIDHWLAIHTTCPFCRLSLLASSKRSTETPQPRHAEDESETGHQPSLGTPLQIELQNREQTQAMQEPSSGNDEAGLPVQQNGRNDAEKHDQSCGFSGNA